MLSSFRRVQEMQASRLAAKRASPPELRVIETAVQTCRHGHATGNHAEFSEGDDAFHMGVATASHNFFLVSVVRETRMLQRQASVIGVHGVGGHAAAAVEEHETIYRAIRDGDPGAAADATAVHSTTPSKITGGRSSAGCSVMARPARPGTGLLSHRPTAGDLR